MTVVRLINFGLPYEALCELGTGDKHTVRGLGRGAELQGFMRQSLYGIRPYKIVKYGRYGTVMLHEFYNWYESIGNDHLTPTVVYREEIQEDKAINDIPVIYIKLVSVSGIDVFEWLDDDMQLK